METTTPIRECPPRRHGQTLTDDDNDWWRKRERTRKKRKKRKVKKVKKRKKRKGKKVKRQRCPQ